MDASKLPMFNGARRWPDRQPENLSPGQPATFHMRPVWADQPKEYVYVQSIKYEPEAPSELGLIYSPSLSDLTKVV